MEADGAAKNLEIAALGFCRGNAGMQKFAKSFENSKTGEEQERFIYSLLSVGQTASWTSSAAVEAIGRDPLRLFGFTPKKAKISGLGTNIGPDRWGAGVQQG